MIVHFNRFDIVEQPMTIQRNYSSSVGYGEDNKPTNDIINVDGNSNGDSGSNTSPQRKAEMRMIVQKNRVRTDVGRQNDG